MTHSPYIPLTAIDCTIPALLIDRNVPLDVLHANATAQQVCDHYRLAVKCAQ